jgi:tRNA A37 threonylcarbamoyladenosine synthetase subunit TsaC/SUA5/YrdC
VIVAEHSSILDLSGDHPEVIRKGKGDVNIFG